MINWPRRKPLSPIAEAYAAANRGRFSRKAELTEVRAIVLDSETTGFRVGADRLLSAAIGEVRGLEFQVSSLRSWLICQPPIAGNESFKIHGILPCDTAAARAEGEVLNELLPLLGGDLLIGHHIGFDAAMLDEALRRNFGVRLKNPLVDTALLAMSVLDAFRPTGYGNQRPPTLDEVCAHLGITMTARHTAAGDVFTTAEVFLTLAARLRKQLGRPLRVRDLPVNRR